MSRKIGKQPRGEEDGPTGMEVIAGNEDLLTQILLRLPVRSLLRFKSVSKHWLCLISNPQFCIIKSKRCCKHISGILLNPHYMEDDSKFNFVPVDHDCPAPLERLVFLDAVDYMEDLWMLETLQYCNGLLLCKIESKETAHYVMQHYVSDAKYYIINPTTKQHTSVSFHVKESADKGLLVSSVALAFDPRKSPHFKLIFLFRAYGGDGFSTADCCVQIYSSETGIMTQFSDLFRTRISYFMSEGFFWNGTINWIDYKSDGLYFNVDEERFGILPMPPAPQNIYGTCHRGVYYYGESYDHLYLVQSNTCSSLQIDVFEMDREYAGWFVRFHVDLQPMLGAFPAKNENYVPNAFGVLAIVDKDDDDNSYIVFSLPGIAVRFHLKDRTFTRICDFSGLHDGGGPPEHNWSNSIHFIESFHPLLNAQE